MTLNLKEDDILVLTAGYWDKPKRIRHKMPLAWARAGNRVLWMEQCPFPPEEWKIPGVLRKSVVGDLREVEERLWVGTAPPAIPYMYKGGRAGNGLRDIHHPLYVRRLKRYLKRLQFDPKIVVLFQQAARHDIFSIFKSACKIYYHHDVYGFGEATSNQTMTLKTCCAQADMVWCVSKLHQRELIDYNSETFHIPHAVDGEWWEQHKDEQPPEYAHIPHPRAVYTGVFQDKIDIPILLETARRCPNWNFVFVGPVIHRHMDLGKLSELKECENVHFLGGREFQRLPGYLAGADALLLPYLPTPLMKDAGLSLKFYEYLITGKPIVITPFTELQFDDKKLIDIATSSEDFADILEKYKNGFDGKMATRRQEIARQNTYENRIQRQRELLEQWHQKRR